MGEMANVAIHCTTPAPVTAIECYKFPQFGSQFEVVTSAELKGAVANGVYCDAAGDWHVLFTPLVQLTKVAIKSPLTGTFFGTEQSITPNGLRSSFSVCVAPALMGRA